MSEHADRVEEFKAEIEGMRLRGSSAEGERRFLALAVVAGVVGLVLALVGGIQVSGTTDPADQRAFMATGTFLGIALLIASAALFVRYSMSRYLRFWLVRLIHESRANTDRLVAALEGRTLDPAELQRPPGEPDPVATPSPGAWDGPSDLRDDEARP